MSHLRSEQLPAERESTDYGRSYVVRICLLAGLIIFLHIIQVTMFLRHDLGSIGQAAVPHSRSLANPNATSSVLPGNSVFWKNEVWVAATTNRPQYPGARNARPASARLVAINSESGTSRETKLVISPAPVGLVVIDDQLWLVSQTAVIRVENDALVERHPKRGLKDPTPPFVYQGKLAVIDAGTDGMHTLLTFEEGEWQQQGHIEVPFVSNASPWIKSGLQVMTDGNNFMLFHWDGNTLSFREGLDFLSEPTNVLASALLPENDQIAHKLSGLSNSSLARSSRPLKTTTELPTEWKTSNLFFNWNQSFDVGYLDGQPTVYLVGGVNSTGQRYVYRDGSWVAIGSTLHLNTSLISLACGPPNFLVADGLQLISTGDSQTSKLTPASIELADRVSFVLSILALCLRYSFQAGLLGIGTWWLMRTYRRPDYLYGKRTATQASVLQRGIARGIDTGLTVFPPAFWFTSLVQWESFQTLGSNTDNTLFFFTFISICGTWLGGVLILSTMQGLWGSSPGKWLCGIRTFRTTLRPCGLLRGIAREMLIYVDGLLLVVWLPGVLSIAFTKNWQRLGDLAADTIVVRDPHRPSWFR